MKTVRFLLRNLPVRGNAQPIQFADGTYKFWEVRTEKGERCIIFREMVGVVTLQQRLDYFLLKEAKLVPAAAIKMVFAHHIVPAGVDSIAAWAQSHAKQMKHFDIQLNR